MSLLQLASSKHWVLVSGRLDQCSLYAAPATDKAGIIKIKNAQGVRCSALARGFPRQTSVRRGPEPPKAAGQNTASVQEPPSKPESPSGGGGGALQPAVIAALLAAGLFGVISKRGPKKEASPAAAAQSLTGSRQFRPPAMDSETKQAAPAALQTMARYFPEAVEQQTYVRAIAKSVSGLGFTNDNCIALVNTCRDEVCRPICSNIDEQFGLTFDIAGLGGLVNCGKTGFKAAMSHSPEQFAAEGVTRERYLFFAFPHISVGETGEVGSLLRRGRGKPSNACGALIAITKDLQSPINDDEEDAEFVLLKRKVQKELSDGRGSGNASLVDVTKAALHVITRDLENLVNKTVDPAKADYAVFTGVQIHSGNQIPGEPFRTDRTVDYIAPHKMYAVVRGQRHELTLDAQSVGGVRSHQVVAA